MPSAGLAFFLESPGAPLQRRDLPLTAPAPGDAIVEVLACGLCHTDLGFANGSVPTKHALPLVLGHEAVGTVTEAGPGAGHLLGRPVIVPAVLPCGSCAFCRAGRGNACPNQRMPGNDVHGGFATHMTVPAAPLVPVDEFAGSVDLRELAVVADAVSTAYQAIRRASVAAGDAVFVVGAGGVGGFVVQIARAFGARVAVCDVRPGPLALLEQHGAERTIDSSQADVATLRRTFSGLLKEWGVPSLNLRIFECSGTARGQSLAFALVARGATLVQVGYTPEPVELRFSNLMAFDATVHGTWGCPPDAYRDVLKLIADGRVRLRPFIDYAPMSSLNELLAAMAAHQLTARMVLDPNH